MPSLSQLPGDISRRKLVRALERLGFEADYSGGDGSHCKVLWPRNQKCVTIQCKLRKDVLSYVLKEIEKVSDVTWDDIKEKL
jgi:predicted RNA binding protein YcfA (HicA-like mRNA interferase family)